jgi:hypothetical protein
LGLKSGEYGGRKTRLAPSRFAQLSNGWRVVSSEIIEQHDITRIQAPKQATAHEFDESGAVHGTFERLMGKYTVGPDSSDHAEVFAPLGGLVVKHPRLDRASPRAREAPRSPPSAFACAS